MTYFSDGKQVVGISMFTSNGTGLSEDWSNDFFEVGVLSKTEMNVEGFGRVAYLVKDTDYLVEQAHDYGNATGEYSSLFEDEETLEKHLRETIVITRKISDWKVIQ